MPKEVHNALTAARVKQEKQPSRYADGGGWSLVVSEIGTRWWQWRGIVHCRQRELGIGSAEAREIARLWRMRLAAGP
jgi:hypothetical protein